MACSPSTLETVNLNLCEPKLGGSFLRHAPRDEPRDAPSSVRPFMNLQASQKLGTFASKTGSSIISIYSVVPLLFTMTQISLPQSYVTSRAASPLTDSHLAHHPCHLVRHTLPVRASCQMLGSSRSPLDCRCILGHVRMKPRALWLPFGLPVS